VLIDGGNTELKDGFQVIELVAKDCLILFFDAGPDELADPESMKGVALMVNVVLRLLDLVHDPLIVSLVRPTSTVGEVTAVLVFRLKVCHGLSWYLQ